MLRWPWYSRAACAANQAAPAGAALDLIGVPVAQGIPADSNPPDWLTAPTTTKGYGQLIDDPRWQGAVSVSHGAVAAVGVADFRAVYKDGFLYMSWVMRTDPHVTLNYDQVYVGFSLPEGNGTTAATLVAFTLEKSSGVFPPAAPGPGLAGLPVPVVASGAASPVGVEVFSGTSNQTDGQKWPKVPTPAWVTGNTAAWVTNVAARGRGRFT